jgi:hypothetical protein
MVRQKLARLERAARRIGAARCRHCGGSDGVGGVPLVLMRGKPWTGTYGQDGRCPRCGATPPHVVEIVFAGDDRDEETGVSENPPRHSVGA